MKKIFSFEKSVGGILFGEFDGKRRYLLLHYISGHWDFPKGHVESGETEQETLRREILEETGINAVSIATGFRRSIFYTYKTGKDEREKKNGVTRVFKKVVFNIAKTENAKVTLSAEHKGFAWLKFEEAINRITHKEGKIMLKKAEEFLSGKPIS